MRNRIVHVPWQSAAPILFRLSLYRRYFRVFELKPIVGRECRNASQSNASSDGGPLVVEGRESPQGALLTDRRWGGLLRLPGVAIFQVLRRRQHEARLSSLPSISSNSTAAPGAVRGAEGDAGQRATQELTRRAPERTPRAPRRARRVSPRGSWRDCVQAAEIALPLRNGRLLPWGGRRRRIGAKTIHDDRGNREKKSSHQSEGHQG